MGFEWFKRLFAAPPVVDEFSAVRSGKMHLRGQVKGGPQQLRSPVKGIPCVAFFYKAWYPTQGRTGVIERMLKTAEVYAPMFFLEMAGGSVRVLPEKTGSFDAAQHRELQSGGYQGFRASDQAIKIGEKISIEGRVQRDSDGWFIRPKEIHLVKESDLPKKPLRSTRKKTHRK
ncbi:MAG: hypothetical protein JW797_08830 [Bradymonadales bacterium]|nr:hypothetical protein [Bradymonadales bacterium]